MKKLWILFLLLIFAVGVQAFPKFTDRENALRLSKVIDKAQFKSHQIASVFVKNRTEKEYYLQIILDDGSTHDWYMDSIYRWSLTDQLLPQKNRVLIFPSEESTNFYVLDKNAFYQKVLTSIAFVKTYPEHDTLEGNHLVFAIRRFRMIRPEEEARYSTDKQGNRYRYVLELKNGAIEVFTYLDAYDSLQRGAFLQIGDIGDEIILERSFQVQGLRIIPKNLEDELRNIWRFGIEVLFDRPILLNEDLFPFQIVEESSRHPRTGERINRFFLHILFPNAEKKIDIQSIRTLEYLQNVTVITDVAHQKRIFLRAQISPEVFELPPYIQVTDYNSVKIFFFVVTDQSVAKREEFSAPPKARAALHPILEPKLVTTFDKYYLKAVQVIRSVQGIHRLDLKIKAYLDALDLLEQAALNAKTDDQISQAFSQRDVLFEILPEMIVDHIQVQLKKTSQPIDRQILLNYLDRAESMVANPAILEKIISLKNILE